VAFPVGFRRRPDNTLALSCECVISSIIIRLYINVRSTFGEEPKWHNDGNYIRLLSLTCSGFSVNPPKIVTVYVCFLTLFLRFTDHFPGSGREICPCVYAYNNVRKK